jgi:hypothetical protein
MFNDVSSTPFVQGLGAFDLFQAFTDNDGTAIYVVGRALVVFKINARIES